MFALRGLKGYGDVQDAARGVVCKEARVQVRLLCGSEAVVKACGSLVIHFPKGGCNEDGNEIS